MLLSFGCIFIVFLMSCFWIAKDADEKVDQFGPPLNIKHEMLKENTHVGMETRFHTAKIAGSSSASPNMEIETLS
jgi:hypothetical protein